MHFAWYHTKVDLATDALAERSKAVAQGAIPKGRGFEPHRCHFDVCQNCWSEDSLHPMNVAAIAPKLAAWIGTTILPAGLEPATYGS